ncbi:sugar transferase [Jeotgalibacillus campisalis]|uniref:General glycosylation pathway protein n=1 Tax=Jeotgalibacillus campisalis TaxID=220754 RepID=A0A0C2V3Z2_9BACL|nr:sugar transferase [Jeotgalibacillus campisalis]KIL43762.1 general glycosylation pathway protein [Jeotgalibacillus campisalis]
MQNGQNRESPSRRGSKDLYSRYYKRMIDFVLALAAVILLSPILLVVILLIKLDSKGPVFFMQERPGMDRKIFMVYKFRTMKQDAVLFQKAGVEIRGSDSRITPIGTFLRRFKIDELAQLINILKGDMSFVGPRPNLPEYLEQYEEWELERFKVKPGLTGLAQVNGNIYLERKEKSAHDIKYINQVSFAVDMKIILKTLAIVLLGEEKFLNKSKSIVKKGSEK